MIDGFVNQWQGLFEGNGLIVCATEQAAEEFSSGLKPCRSFRRMRNNRWRFFDLKGDFVLLDFAVPGDELNLEYSRVLVAAPSVDRDWVGTALLAAMSPDCVVTLYSGLRVNRQFKPDAMLASWLSAGEVV